MALPYLLETHVAISAVTRACYLTSSVFRSIKANSIVTKSDASPVTVADYAAQAVVNTILGNTFPNDPIVGEESAAELREGVEEKWQGLRDTITTLANDVLSTPVVPELGEEEKWGLGPSAKLSTANLLDAIDRGGAEGGRTGRMWTLDPIDGTKGFLRGGQYAICLALIVDSQVQVGVIGCPNLPFGPSTSLNGFANLGGGSDVKPGEGSIFVAVKGQGAQQLPFPPNAKLPPRPLGIPQSNDSRLLTLRLLESFESGHSSHSFSSVVSSVLNITEPPLRMDSQAKFCALAAQSEPTTPTSLPNPSPVGSGGDIYFRLVPNKNYLEKIWDHASGSLLVQEAGGIVSDSNGKPLDFGLGRTLGANYGVVAASRDVHPLVIDAIAKARDLEAREP